MCDAESEHDAAVKCYIAHWAQESEMTRSIRRHDLRLAWDEASAEAMETGNNSRACAVAQEAEALDIIGAE